MMESMMGSYGHMIGFHWFYPLVFLVLFFLIVWWMIKNSGTFGFSSEESAIDILKRRLAKGEITQKEFSALKKEIEDGDKQ